MTIYRETCDYEKLTVERAAEFGVPPEDVGLWLIEYEYGEIPFPGLLDDEAAAAQRGRAVSVRVIPNTMARLVAGRGVLIL